MNKIWLIITREYLTRVKKKSFLVTTFLIPLLMAGVTFLMMYMSLKSEQKQSIVLIDESGIFINKMDTNSSSYTFKYLAAKGSENYEDILTKQEGDILVHVYPFKNGQPDSVNIYKDGGVSLIAKEYISDDLNTIYQVKQMQDAGIDKAKIDSINNHEIAIKSFDLKSNKETSSEIASAIGYGTGFLIYLVILIYGMGVMRGVSEEKVNRIAEVIISSVKPFQLMMGKIVGIALVGLTQFGLWLLLTGTLQLFIPFLIPGMSDSLPSGATISEVQQNMKELPHNELSSLLNSLYSQNWLLIISCFIFYFLGGYFLYAAMFAAVGSMVDEDQQEAQQMTLPITMPIIFGFIIMASSIKDPNSPLSIFGSLFPLTSPIVMMGRIPSGVPAWQLLLSMLFLIIGFVGMTWISAKIYRTGILMYGKKMSWKEAIKWLRSS